MTQKCVVTEANKRDIYKDWKKGGNKYSLSKSISAEDIIDQKASKGNPSTNSKTGGKWMNLEDTEPNAIITNLNDNEESFTGFNGNSK